jgi:energy-coupling factor transporter ATP-binding protein EcfA2
VENILSAVVETDKITDQLSQSFDYEFTGKSTFLPPHLPEIPQNFCIGLIVGASGSGKSTLLKQFGTQKEIKWAQDKAICSHFVDANDAQIKLAAVGLNNIPTWMRPYHVLSTGEKFRADLARQLIDGAIVDEFTSVVDRNVAKACSYALRRYCDQQKLHNIVLASCHYDIIEWLQPDWVFDTNTGQLAGRGSQRRPEIKLEIVPCTTEAWAMFSQHHYLSCAINKSSRCWLILWGDTPIGFSSALAYPSGTVKNAWREHRTVVLPDYQGLGLGVRISDSVAQMFKNDGCRYFSKTSHPRMGGYREISLLWKPTSKNKKARKDYSLSRKTKEDGHKMLHVSRVCYSHEFIGLTE